MRNGGNVKLKVIDPRRPTLTTGAVSLSLDSVDPDQEVRESDIVRLHDRITDETVLWRRTGLWSS